MFDRNQGQNPSRRLPVERLLPEHDLADTDENWDTSVPAQGRPRQKTSEALAQVATWDLGDGLGI